ncbi:alpha/beta hydrolase [Massilia sp. Leaf139]|uniref:alpha/beta hydrolase n=1 Tax=Massilia sp. Leaf139 TaxID=1736272 RepID=UPI0006FB894F|nr:alpha/beta fold hydrolase [Massilia sp. Leaf139]KQQ91860.1 PhoP [Massilia sp. Leaf139]
MQKTLGFLLVLVLVLYLGACLALFLVQRSLIYFPPAQAAIAAPKVSTLSVPDAMVKVSERPHPGRQALIYLGGNGEDVSMSLPQLDAAFPEHALYLLHYRGYTGSTGKPSEAALVADALSLFDRVAAGHLEIVLVGRSLGTGIALQVASRRPAQKLVLVTPYDSLAALAAGQFPLFPVRWLLRDRYESLRHAPQVKAPTLVIRAQHDEVIPAASTARLLASFADGVAAEVVIAGAGHNTISESPGYLQALAWARQ